MELASSADQHVTIIVAVISVFGIAFVGAIGFMARYIINHFDRQINALFKSHEVLAESQAKQSEALAVLVAQTQPTDIRIQALEKRTATLSETTAVLANEIEHWSKYASRKPTAE